ncbi:MAG: sulfur carrier protein ThiS [Methylacidiphilales bacterium]|nr:sulfur carrier protein ThiS [Candidatus Methylacidiphilales bacterium]MDW8348663.1 sulfur carrier protein ThiS [Verrucomicrobiae bacterium]
MQIYLQGQPHQIPNEINTISALLEHLQLPRKGIVIELNQTALHLHEWDTTPIQEGDAIELIRIVAGG